VCGTVLRVMGGSYAVLVTAFFVVITGLIILNSKNSIVEAKRSRAARSTSDDQGDISYIRCTSKMGKLSHYYHFTMNCVIPSVLFYRAHPKHRIVLCNNDALSVGPLTMLPHYKAILPMVETSANCSRMVEESDIVVLPGYDDHHGSGASRLELDDWQTVHDHFQELTPADLPTSYLFPKWDILLVRRANSTAFDNTTLTAMNLSMAISGASRRSISNIFDVERGLMSTFGADRVKMVVLEDMSIIEQYWTFYNAKIVVGQHGAGLVNVVYANREGFQGLIEMSPYVYDRHGLNFRAFSECFEYLSQARNTQYIKVHQDGEFGPVAVADVKNAVTELLKGSTAGKHLVNETRVHLKCRLPTADAVVDSGKHTARDTSLILYEYYLGCLFPGVLYSIRHPKLVTISFCGVPLTFMDSYLKKLIPKVVSSVPACDLDPIPLDPFFNHRNEVSVSRRDKFNLLRHLIDMRVVESRNDSYVFNATNTSCDILLIDSSLSLFNGEQSEYFPITNFGEVQAALEMKYGQRNVTTVKLFELSVAARAIYFHIAKIIVVHEGSALVNLMFAPVDVLEKNGRVSSTKVVQLTLPPSNRDDDEVDINNQYSSFYSHFGIERTKVVQDDTGKVDVLEVLTAVSEFKR
jgi:hypothetical protein